MLVAQDPETGRRLAAAEHRRGDPVVCPQCSADLRLNRGERKVPYFSHPPASDCSLAVESAEHLRMKAWAQHVWAGRCALEVPVGEVRRADAVVGAPSGFYALEFQASPLPFEDLELRSQDLSRHGLTPVWIFHKDRVRDRGNGRVQFPAEMLDLARIQHLHVWAYDSLFRLKLFAARSEDPFGRMRDLKATAHTYALRLFQPLDIQSSPSGFGSVAEGRSDRLETFVREVSRSEDSAFRWRWDQALSDARGSELTIPSAELSAGFSEEVRRHIAAHVSRVDSPAEGGDRPD